MVSSLDTSGFHALLVKRDDMHRTAAQVLASAAKRRARFVTTDYVFDETATLLCARGQVHLVAPFMDSTLKSQACIVEWTNPDRLDQSAAFLDKHLDQGYSFTDCVSLATMKACGLRDALTKDEHFDKAGFVALLRSA